MTFGVNIDEPFIAQSEKRPAREKSGEWRGGGGGGWVQRHFKLRISAAEFS